MPKEFGGYFPIELAKKHELFTESDGMHVMRYDCGRNAIAAAALGVQAKKLYIPHYNCDTVRDTLAHNGIEFEPYLLTDTLEPDVPELCDGEWLVWVNYFGNSPAEKYAELANKYRRVIFDNTQAFFAPPVLNADCFNVYSPRKFVGVSDGAYVVWGGEHTLPDDYPQDVSWERAAFMFKSIELGTHAAYGDNLASMEHMGKDIRMMSELTRRILSSIDYEEVRLARRANIAAVHELLGDINAFPFEIDGDLMVYPLYAQNDRLRRLLIENKIYVSQWWKYLLDIVPENSIEARFSKWLLPLPIDQRYSPDDMREMALTVRKCFEQAK